MSVIFTRYELYARAAGFSRSQIDHKRRCISYFDQFLGGIKDPAAVTPDDFRRYLAYLPTKPVWKGLKNEQARLLSGTSVNTYAVAIMTFFKWMADEKIIPANPLAAVRVPKKLSASRMYFLNIVSREGKQYGVDPRVKSDSATEVITLILLSEMGAIGFGKSNRH